MKCIELAYYLNGFVGDFEVKVCGVWGGGGIQGDCGSHVNVWGVSVDFRGVFRAFQLSFKGPYGKSQRSFKVFQEVPVGGV